MDIKSLLRTEKIVMKIESRESIEWLNYWIEDANNLDKKRILIIGDSVARDCRTILNKIVQKENFVVDLLAMSYSIFDIALIEEIEHFIKSIVYKYQFILFNMGAHHGHSIKCKMDKQVQKEYYQKLESIFIILEKFCNNILTIAGTPENMNNTDSDNIEIETRNQILKAVAQKYNYKFVDLYKLLSVKNFPMMDRFHYTECGYEYMANTIYEALGFHHRNYVSNRIDSLTIFLQTIKDVQKIYIYGDGKKGKLLHDFLIISHLNMSDRYIVSDRFYINEKKQVMLNDAIRNMSVNDVILVTLEDNDVWQRIESLNINYFTFSKNFYIYAEEYINTYALIRKDNKEYEC